jgi:hypothetical protein
MGMSSYPTGNPATNRKEERLSSRQAVGTASMAAVHVQAGSTGVFCRWKRFSHPTNHRGQG